MADTGLILVLVVFINHDLQLLSFRLVFLLNTFFYIKYFTVKKVELYSD